MRFTTLISASGAVAIAGLITLGAVAPASAAPVETGKVKASVQAQGDRLEGPFQTKTRADYSNRANWVVVGNQVNLGAGGTWTFPAAGTTGPIVSIDTGKCLDSTGLVYMNNMIMAQCDGSVGQTYAIAANGTITNVADGSGVSDNFNGIGSGPLIFASADQVAGGGDALWFDNLTPVAAVKDLTAELVSVDADAKSAVIGGAGEPGADIEITNPDGSKQTVKVGDDGTWTATVPGLKDGDNPINVKQTVGTDVQSKDLVATILPSPIVDPSIAGGAGVAALAALGAVALVRRRKLA